MEKPCVVISGPTVALDDELDLKLNKYVMTLKCPENGQIKTILETTKVDTLLFEITVDARIDLNIIKTIKAKFPHVEIILIDGTENRNVLAQAFAFGAKDAFPKAYDRRLLVERIQALLRQI